MVVEFGTAVPANGIIGFASVIWFEAVKFVKRRKAN